MDFAPGGLQQDTETTWFADLDVSYKVGLYDFSLWLVGLTAFVTVAAVAYGLWAGRPRPRAYFGLLLFLAGATVGVFAAQDLLLFYVFFEAMLIPLYVLIGVWGGAGRASATIKFLDLHARGLAAHARRDHRARARERDVRHDAAPGERQQLDLPRLPRRVRRQGAALPLPRVAARRVPRGARRGDRPPLGRRVEDRRLRDPADRPALVSGARRRLACGRAHARLDRPRVRARSSPFARPTSAA